jgi:hypothetical protein
VEREALDEARERGPDGLHRGRVADRPDDLAAELRDQAQDGLLRVSEGRRRVKVALKFPMPRESVACGREFAREAFVEPLPALGVELAVDVVALDAREPLDSELLFALILLTQSAPSITSATGRSAGGSRAPSCRGTLTRTARSRTCAVP